MTVPQPAPAAADARGVVVDAGALGLSALGEIRAVANTLGVCGSGTGATKMRQMATALRAACDALTSDLAAALARAERAEAALRTRIDAEYLAAFAADDAARARLAADRAGIPPTERDRRGVPLGTGAGVGGGAL